MILCCYAFLAATKIVVALPSLLFTATAIFSFLSLPCRRCFFYCHCYFFHCHRCFVISITVFFSHCHRCFFHCRPCFLTLSSLLPACCARYLLLCLLPAAMFPACRCACCFQRYCLLLWREKGTKRALTVFIYWPLRGRFCMSYLCRYYFYFLFFIYFLCSYGVP